MKEGTRDKTTSTRIYEEQFDTIKDRIEDRDYSLSHLQRFSIELGTAEDEEAAQEFLDIVGEFYDTEEVTFRYCVDYFLDENPRYIEELVPGRAEGSSKIDPEAVEEGVKKMLSGVYFHDSEEAMAGGRMLDEVDTTVGNTAVQYLSKFPEEYWQQ